MSKSLPTAIVVVIAPVLVAGSILSFTGHAQYLYHRARIAMIDDPEQGWSKKIHVIDEMSKVPGPCADFALADTIRCMNNQRFSFVDARTICARKSAFVGRPWADIAPQISHQPICNDQCARFRFETIFYDKDNPKDAVYFVEFSLDSKKVVAGMTVRGYYDDWYLDPPLPQD